MNRPDTPAGATAPRRTVIAVTVVAVAVLTGLGVVSLTAAERGDAVPPTPGVDGPAQPGLQPTVSPSIPCPSTPGPSPSTQGASPTITPSACPSEPSPSGTPTPLTR